MDKADSYNKESRFPEIMKKLLEKGYKFGAMQATAQDEHGFYAHNIVLKKTHAGLVISVSDKYKVGVNRKDMILYHGKKTPADIIQTFQKYGWTAVIADPSKHPVTPLKCTPLSIEDILKL